MPRSSQYVSSSHWDWIKVHIPAVGGYFSCRKTKKWHGPAASELSNSLDSIKLTTRHQDVLKHDGALLLPPEDPQSKRVARVTSRLVTALEEQQHHVVCDATWPPRSSELGRVISEREAAYGDPHGERYKPSGVATSSFMPFRPVSSNPLKKLETGDWNLYVIDLVGSVFLTDTVLKHLCSHS